MLITESSALRDFCAAVSTAPFIAVDTEFIRERTYWPKLCLVQISDGEESAAIDALAPGIDLSSLFDLMRNQSVLKVFHSAGQDINVFHTVMSAVPAPVFDTQLAAMVCGFGDQPAYATLVMELTGERIDKASQMTDWSRRPLTERQISYAISDVTHLVTIYKALYGRLEETGRREWVSEEIARLADASAYETDPMEQWRKVRIRRPSRKALVVLREVAAWRERVAQRRDMPRGWVLKDESMAEIAANQPETIEQLERVRGVSARFAEGKDGQALLGAVRRALSLPGEEWPELPSGAPLLNGNSTIVALLQALLKISSDTHGVAPALIANRRDLEMLAENDDAEVPALKGWRRSLFGADALRLKHGKLALTGTGHEAVAVDLDGKR
jgi:ribonuclease D